MGIPTWVYASGEYHVEAYETHTVIGPQSERVQFSDLRAMGGIRFEAPRITTFIEAGWIFDRRVKFDRVGGDFKVDSGFTTRIGLRF